MDVNNFDFWYVLGQNWNWFWFLVIVTFGIGRAGVSK